MTNQRVKPLLGLSICAKTICANFKKSVFTSIMRHKKRIDLHEIADGALYSTKKGAFAGERRERRPGRDGPDGAVETVVRDGHQDVVRRLRGRAGELCGPIRCV